MKDKQEARDQRDLQFRLDLEATFGRYEEGSPRDLHEMSPQERYKIYQKSMIKRKDQEFVPIERKKGQFRNSLGSESGNLVSAFRGQVPLEQSFEYLVSQDHRKTTESKRKEGFFCFCVSAGDSKANQKGRFGPGTPKSKATAQFTALPPERKNYKLKQIREKSQKSKTTGKSNTTGDHLHQDPDDSSFIERASHVQGFDEFGRPSFDQFDHLEALQEVVMPPSEQLEEQKSDQKSPKKDLDEEETPDGNNNREENQQEQQSKKGKKLPSEPSVHVQFYETPNECLIF